MPIIVPIEENHVGLASATDAKFRPGDYSGSGLEALGAGLAKVGAGGQQFASALDEKRRHELAAAIAAAHLDDDHQRNLDDAAAKKAYVDYGDQAAALLHGDDGILNHAGADAHTAFPALVAALADSHDNAMASLDPIQRGAVAHALGDRLRGDVGRAAAHVRQQGVVEQRSRSEALQKAAARDAVAHVDDPDLHDHHMATGENAIRQQARIANLPDKELERQLADYKSGVHADSIEALAARDPVHAAGWYATFGDNLNEADERRIEAVLGPALAGSAEGRDQIANAAPSGLTAADMSSSTAGMESSDGSTGPYGNLQELMKRFPGGGQLQDASAANSRFEEPSPEIARQRADLADRWRRLTAKQRLNDPELATPAKAFEAAKTLLLTPTPKLFNALGAATVPGGKYVVDLIMDQLNRIIHDEITSGHKFKTVSDVDLQPNGKHSLYLFDEIRLAASRALNRRQRIAWNFFTTGDHPYTNEQAAGLIAALTLENSLDPDKLQVGGGNGYGIAQWNKYRSDIFAKVMGRAIKGSTFEQQLAYVKYELDQGIYKTVGAQLRNMGTAYDSGFLITKSYEAPRERVNTPIRRGQYANEVLREFQTPSRK